jgi:hypothetical protein
LPYLDRIYLVADHNKIGKYEGRLYLVGRVESKDAFGGKGHGTVLLYRSLDEGKTFLGPVSVQYPEGATAATIMNGTVLSDGTFVTVAGVIKPGRSPHLEHDTEPRANAELYAISSSDGGETSDEPHKITDWTVDLSRSTGGVCGQLAVDPGSSSFKDRLYFVFPAVVDGRDQVQFSYSEDKGRTWSTPITVNDDRSPKQADKGPDQILPSIGVNKDGVVLVTWYDRREALDNMGWRLRGAASLDGGETFSASEPLADAANMYLPTTGWPVFAQGHHYPSPSMVALFVVLPPFFIDGGHTSGLAVDASGIFHPTWVDNRTGVSQLWTASVQIKGAVVKNGAPDLAVLDDLSKSVSLEAQSAFDRVTGVLNVTARLRNISRTMIEGPVKLRVLSLTSDSAIPEIINADNGEIGTGAVWDFSEQLTGGKLAPEQVSASRTLRFRLSDIYPIEPGWKFRQRFLRFNGHVFGKASKQ